MVHTIRIVSSVALLLSVFLIGLANAQSDLRPNFVVVLVDDMRWDDFGAAGHPFVQTPNIDRIAVEGVHFTNAFAVTPLCSPSRASILTGQYISNHGIVDNTNRGGFELETFPRRLDEAGYDTAFVGKWHMGTDGSPRPGFDTWVGIPGQGSNIDAELHIDGERITTSGHITDVLTEHAISFLEQERNSPFLLYLSHKAVHPDPALGLTDGGFIAAERHRGIYDDQPIQRSPSAGVPPLDKPALMRPVEGLPPLGFDTATTDLTIRQRLEMVTGVDESVGSVLAVLESMGELDNTVFVVLSDHGYFYGEHGLNPQRRLAYEESIRIPLLIRHPALDRSGQSVDSLVTTLDLAPTLLEFAGLSAELDGRSLVPLLEQKEVEWREAVLIEFFSDPPEYFERSRGADGLIAPQVREYVRTRGMSYNAVRTSQYKYIQYSELDDADELYDLENDPYELNNLIDDSSYQEIRQILSREILRLKPLQETP